MISVAEGSGKRMDDYISRQAAIDALSECVRAYPSRYYNGIEVASSALRKIPAADVRPVVRGTWKSHKTKTGKNWWKCSACDYVSEHKAHHNCCPNCGAEMREE